MRIQSYRIRNYRGIVDSGLVSLEPDVTCLFGPQRDGVVWLLDALAKGYPIAPLGYDLVQDCPHAATDVRAASVLEISFLVEAEDATQLIERFEAGSVITYKRYYDGSSTLDPHIDASIWRSVLEPALPRVLLFARRHILEGRAQIQALQNPGADEGLRTLSYLLALAEVTPAMLMDPSLAQLCEERLERTGNEILAELPRDVEEHLKADVLPGNALQLRVHTPASGTSIALSEMRPFGLAWFISCLLATRYASSAGCRLIVLLDLAERVQASHLFAFMQTHFAALGHQAVYNAWSKRQVEPGRSERVRVVEHVAGKGTLVSAQCFTSDVPSRLELRERIHLPGLDPEQRVIRPAAPRRLVFADLMSLGGFPGVYVAHDVVPIESAQLGDEQVFAARTPFRITGPFDLRGSLQGTWHPPEPEPIIDLDTLVDLPSVTSVVASTVIRARRPLPHIQELILLPFARPFDRETLAHLTGLKRLWASLWPFLTSDWVIPDGLEELGLDRTGLEPDGLMHLSKLTELRKFSLRHGFPKDTMKALSASTRLTHLRIENVRAGWTALARCADLIEVDMEPRIASLRPFKRWTKLRKLTLHGRGLKSLDGIEHLEALESLALHETAFHDFSPLGKLTNLRELRVQGKCAANAASSEQLCHVLCELRSLESYHADEIQQSMSDALVAAHPQLELVYHVMHHSPAMDIAPASHVTVHAPEADIPQWSIFESLAERLDKPTNYDAEKYLKRELRQRHPDVLRRLEWDTEAGNVCVYAASEPDIRVVETIANELIARHGIS